MSAFRSIWKENRVKIIFMKKISIISIAFLFLYQGSFAQLIIDYESWTGATGCNIFSSSTNVPCSLNGSSSIIAHLSLIAQPEYAGDPDNAVSMDCRPVYLNGSITHYEGTEYRITYTFKQNHSYFIEITAMCISAAGSPNAVLRLQANNGSGTASSACNGPDNIDPTLTGGLMTYNNISSSQYATYNFSYAPFASQQSYLNIAAIPPANTGNQTILIRNIKITETPPGPSFSLSPTSVNVSCGSTVNQTFTVTNLSNTPGVTYEWDLGSSMNGWLYNGIPAQQVIATGSTNSITLTSVSCSNVLSNVSAVIKINNVTHQTITANASISLPEYNISGKAIICNSETYTLNGNLPCNATIHWSLSPSYPVLQFSPNPPTGSSVTMTNQKWYGTTATLTATVSNLGCTVSPITATKIIANDNDASATTPYSYNQQACNFYNVSHSSQSGTVYTSSSPTFVHQGCTVTVNVGNLPQVNKSVTFMPTGTSSVTQPIFWYYSNSQLVFALPYGSGGIPFTFRISGDGSCYNKDLLFFTYANNGRISNSGNYTFEIAPNPVKNVLRIKANTAKEGRAVHSEITDLVYNYEIVDISTNQNILVSKQILNPSYSINISNLKSGLYIIKIYEGTNMHTLKFYKE